MPPRLAIPLRFAAGRAATVEQDSDADVLQCVETIARYRVGQRPELPEFGIPDQSHRQGGADQAAIADAVLRWEPRVERLQAEASWEDEVQRVVEEVAV